MKRVFLIVVSLCFAWLVVAILRSPIAKPSTFKPLYYSIEEGMTLDQAGQILGDPADDEVKNGNGTRRWRTSSNAETIGVGFVYGKVARKYYATGYPFGKSEGEAWK